MKTLILIMSLMALGLMGVGCSKSNSQAVDNPNLNATIAAPIVIDPIDTTTTTTGGQVFAGGSTSTFTPTSMSAMNAYVGVSPYTHLLNDPTSFKVNVNLAQSSSGRYGGTVTISYIDNGVEYDGVFNAGMGTNQSFKGMYDNGRPEADYNYWFNYGGKTVFTGFFQDNYGSITLTLEPETTSTGGGNDGEPITTTTYKGTIYFKNFATSFAGQSPYRSCWYIYNGPYDCRSNVVQTKCGLYPGSEAGYQVLGTFTGLDVKTGFNTSN